MPKGTRWVLAIFCLLIAFGAGMTVNLFSSVAEKNKSTKTTSNLRKQKALDTRLRKEERGCWNPLGGDDTGNNVCAETVWRFVSFKEFSGAKAEAAGVAGTVMVKVSYKTIWDDITKKQWRVNYSFKFKDMHGLEIVSHPANNGERLGFTLYPMKRHTEEGTFSLRLFNLEATDLVSNMRLYASFLPKTGSEK